MADYDVELLLADVAGWSTPPAPAQLRALRGMLNWYRAMRRRGFGELLYDVPVIDVPTLMIWGEEDHALGKKTTFGTERYVRDLLGVCRARLERELATESLVPTAYESHGRP